MLIEIILMLLAFFILLGSVAYGIYYLSVNKLNPQGNGAENKTTHILTKFGLIRGFKVLSEVKFQYKGQTYFIENMLIGFFGILIVHTLGARGEYYGQIDGKEWQLVLEDKKQSFPNPVLEQQKAISALRAIFSQNKAFNIPIENIVVLTSKAKKTGLFITNDNIIFLPGQLKPYLHKTKFEKDADIDVDQLAEIIEANRI